MEAEPEAVVIDNCDSIIGTRDPEPRSVRISPHRGFICRYDLRVRVEPSEQPDATIAAALKKVMIDIQKVDSSLAIYAWSDEDVGSVSPILTPATHFPNTMADLHKYFNRLYSQAQGGDIYMSVRLGHERATKDIRIDLKTWAQTTNNGLWLRPLQVERAEIVGWLLYSCQQIDLAALTEAISNRIAVKVGLRYRAIYLGRQRGAPQTQPVRTIHIEVDACDHAYADRFLSRIYGRTPTGSFPNGVRMRLVPPYDMSMSPSTCSQLERLRARQEAFLSELGWAFNWDFNSLDFTDRIIGVSLCDMIIMSLRVKDKPHLSLFHTVDLQWDRPRYVATFLPQHADKARMLLIGLLPYFLFHHPDKEKEITKFFTPAAIHWGKQVKWDPDKHCTISPTDDLCSIYMTEDTDYDFTARAPSQKAADAVSPDGPDQPTQPDPGRLQRQGYYEDDDSVSTIESRPGRGRPRNRAPPTAESLSRPQSRARSCNASARNQAAANNASTALTTVTTDTSVVSSVTMDDRMLTMESKLDSRMDEMSTLKSDLNSRFDAMAAQLECLFSHAGTAPGGNTSNNQPSSSFTQIDPSRVVGPRP